MKKVFQYFVSILFLLKVLKSVQNFSNNLLLLTNGKHCIKLMTGTKRLEWFLTSVNFYSWSHHFTLSGTDEFFKSTKKSTIFFSGNLVEIECKLYLFVVPGLRVDEWWDKVAVPDCIGSDCIGPYWIESDRIGFEWIVSDLIGLNRTRSDSYSSIENVFETLDNFHETRSFY